MSNYITHSYDPYLYRALLWGIARPWSKRDPQDETRFHATSVSHPDDTHDPSHALRLPTDTLLRMSPAAGEVAEIPDYISQHFTEDELSPLAALKQKMATWYSQSAADEIQIAWEGQKGSRITAADFLPDTIVANAQTEVQLANQGFFPDRVLEWEQPSGAQDAYDTSVLVSHNGKTGTSDVDANVWEPPTQWTEVDPTT